MSKATSEFYSKHHKEVCGTSRNCAAAAAADAATTYVVVDGIRRQKMCGLRTDLLADCPQESRYPPTVRILCFTADLRMPD